jgi:glycosyltransferase involved in cell wall biosynthesis
MRILHVTDAFAPHVGGIETFVAGLAARQQAHGHEVTVLTRTPGLPTDGDALDVRRVGLGSRWRDTVDADLVHLHLSVVSPLATLASRAATTSSVPTVASVHSLWAGWSGVVRAAALAADWEHAPILWAPVSSVAAEQVRRVLPHAPIRVVPNAVDVEWWRSIAPAPDPVPTLLTTMRLAARKRPLELLGMLAGVRRELPTHDFRAVVIGTGPLELRVRREIHRLGLADQVLLAGQLSPEEIRVACSHAHAYVAPATQESFGIAALEARTVGLPVVAMRRSGVGEFVTHEREGLLCADDRDMTGALVRLLVDHRLREGIAAHNRTVSPRADWSDTVAEYDAAYEAAARLADHRNTRGITSRPAQESWSG